MPFEAPGSDRSSAHRINFVRRTYERISTFLWALGKKLPFSASFDVSFLKNKQMIFQTCTERLFCLKFSKRLEYDRKWVRNWHWNVLMLAFWMAGQTCKSDIVNNVGPAFDGAGWTREWNLGKNGHFLQVWNVTCVFLKRNILWWEQNSVAKKTIF